jgi:hypothetical protein
MLSRREQKDGERLWEQDSAAEEGRGEKADLRCFFGVVIVQGGDLHNLIVY